MSTESLPTASISTASPPSLQSRRCCSDESAVIAQDHHNRPSLPTSDSANVVSVASTKKAASTGCCGSSFKPSGPVDICCDPLMRPVERVAGMVRQTQQSRLTVQDLADQIAGVLLPVSIACAALSFVIWTCVSKLIHGTSTSVAFVTGLTYAIAVVAVSCPCALVLTVSLSRLACPDKSRRRSSRLLSLRLGSVKASSFVRLRLCGSCPASLLMPSTRPVHLHRGVCQSSPAFCEHQATAHWSQRWFTAIPILSREGSQTRWIAIRLQ